MGLRQGEGGDVVRAHSSAMKVTGGVFWAWAVFNNCVSGFDAGAISLAFPVLAAIYTERTLAAQLHCARRLRTLRVATPLACCLPVANYGAALGMCSGWLFIYVAAATAAWVLAALSGGCLLHQRLAALGASDSGKPLLDDQDRHH